MIRKLGAALVLAICSGFAQSRSVCDLLHDLSDLDGRVVKVRGVWGIGDRGQTLTPIRPCLQPTVRDGWVWREILEVYPAHGSASVADVVAKFHRMNNAHWPTYTPVLATLTGRIRTRNHFEVQVFADGSRRPLGFNLYGVAALPYERAEDLKAIPLDAESSEWLGELSRRPDAIRAK